MSDKKHIDNRAEKYELRRESNGEIKRQATLTSNDTQRRDENEMRIAKSNDDTHREPRRVE